MRPDSARIAQQITTFGHPLAQLVQERQLTVRMAFPGNMNWVRLITRWHQRYERELRNAGRGTMSKINDDFDLKAKLFFAKWTRHDWNTYYTTAKESAESALERPLTLSEKKLLVRAIRVKGLALGSSRVLGMFLSMAIQNPADFTSLLMWDGKMK